MMQVIEGSFTPLPDPVGEVIANDFQHGWHVQVNVPWDQIGAGTKLYTAQQMTAFAKEVARKSQIAARCNDTAPVAPIGDMERIVELSGIYAANHSTAIRGQSNFDFCFKTFVEVQAFVKELLAAVAAQGAK